MVKWNGVLPFYAEGNFQEFYFLLEVGRPTLWPSLTVFSRKITWYCLCCYIAKHMARISYADYRVNELTILCYIWLTYSILSGAQQRYGEKARACHGEWCEGLWGTCSGNKSLLGLYLRQCSSCTNRAFNFQVIATGKLGPHRAESMKAKDGYMISSVHLVNQYIDVVARHVLLRQFWGLLLDLKLVAINKWNFFFTKLRLMFYFLLAFRV